MDSKWQNMLHYDRRKSSVVLVIILSVAVVIFYWSELLGSEHRNVVVSQPTTSLTPSNSGAFVIGKKVATIIENRQSENLIPLILHFSSVLGPGWPIVLFTSLSPLNLTDSAPFKAGLKGGQFEIRPLPNDVQFTNHKDVSSFLTKPWFWEQLAPADHVLLFQSDSIICANAPQHVDDYLQYDMIGAPIANGMGQGYNGGLSLRNRKKMLDIVRKHNWLEKWEERQRQKAEDAEAERLRKEEIAKEQQEKEQQQPAEEEQQPGEEQQQPGEEQQQPDEGQQQPSEEHEQPQGDEHEKMQGKQEEEEPPGPPPEHTYVFPENPTPPWEDYEDQWFFKRLTELPRKWNGARGANLPGVEIAKTFSVETVDYDKPLGYHQVGLIIKDKMDQVESWCPEYRLCTDKRFATAE